MNTVSLEEILRKKKEHKANLHPIDWNKEREFWIQSVEDLYKEIELWLNDFKKKELLDFAYSDIELNEGNIGKYKVRQMCIKLGEDEIKLTPIGTMLIGAFGKINLESRSKTIPLILVRKELDVQKISQFSNNLENNDDLIENESQEEKWKSLTWEILLKDANKPLSIQLDNISLQDIIKEIISNE